MSYASAIEDLTRYARTRFTARVYLPLALFLCVAAAAGVVPGRPADFAVAMVVAYALVFQFRLWDDLADRERDRRNHPERVLANSRSIRVFVFLLVVVFAVNLGVFVLRVDTSRVLIYLLMNGAALVWYLRLRSLVTDATASAHVLLLKYPVIVYLLGGWFPRGSVGYLTLSMALVYLCFCIYETLHDPELVVGRSSRLLAAEVATLVAIPTLYTLLLHRGWIAPLFQATVAVAASVVVVFLFRRRRLQAEPGLWSYTPFAVGFLQVLSMSVGAVP